MNVIYWLMWLFVTAVASADTYINIRYPITAAWELNPIAGAVLQASNDDHALLLAIKFAGTSLVLGYLGFLYCYNRNLGHILLAGLTAFQCFFLIVVFW